METPIPEAIFTYWPVAALIGTFAIVGAALKTLRGAWDFHYDYFTRRHLKRIAELLPLTEPGSQQHRYLKAIIDAEVFKIASGVKTTDQKATALMHLSELGLISSNQLKKYSVFVSPTANGDIEITIRPIDTVFMVYAAICAAAVFFYSVWTFGRMAYLSHTTDTVLPAVIGSLLFLGSAYVVRYFLNDVRRYRTAKEIKARLKSEPLPTCEALKTPSIQ